ncbi:succinyl-:3-ketoacid-coenzyme A transferase mitochondrial precursor, partial [Fusarium phyllophilum]
MGDKTKIRYTYRGYEAWQASEPQLKKLIQDDTGVEFWIETRSIPPMGIPPYVTIDYASFGVATNYHKSQIEALWRPWLLYPLERLHYHYGIVNPVHKLTKRGPTWDPYEGVAFKTLFHLQALKDMKPNTTILCGGFGLWGVPDTLINEVLNKPDVTGLTAVSNNTGTDNFGLGKLLKSRQVRKMVASYIGEYMTFEKMYLTGDIELELTPQGTLAERCAAGGKGIPAFYTPAGVGTLVQNGDLRSRNKAIGSSGDAQFPDPKDVKFRLAGQSFNGSMGRNAKMTIVEAKHIAEPGEIPQTKGIEKYTWDEQDITTLGQGEVAAKRERIVRRAAKEFKNGMYADLGIGMPMLAASFVGLDVDVQLQSENGILVTLKPGASVFSSDESFGMLRSGRIDVTILGAMQVSETGDLANWMLPGKVKGFGGAMDLVSNPSKTKVIVTMEHTDKKGNPKILNQCSFSLTGRACVSRIITDLGVFGLDFATGLTLIEIAPGVTVDEVKAKTEAPFTVAKALESMTGA